MYSWTLTSINVSRKANGTVSFNDEKENIEGGRKNKSQWDTSGHLQRELSVPHCFLCDYMFNLLHISKIVCYDRPNLQWSLCRCQTNERKTARKMLPQLLMDSQWFPKPAGPREHTAPAIIAEDLHYTNTPCLSPSVIITSLQGCKKGKKQWRKGAGVTPT